MIYAIDFGTSNSLLGAADREKIYAPIPLDPAAADPTIFRSILFLPNRQTCYFGAEATKQYIENEMNGRLIRSIKKFLPNRSFLGTFVDDRAFYIEDIIGAFLGQMRSRANAHFGVDCRRVVLGRPAKFSDDPAEDKFAEERLKSSAMKAGFEEIYFCPEPLAAAYDFQTSLKQSKVVFVADFGGGTSDFTVLRLEPDTKRELEVLGLGGVSQAGDAFDGALMRYRIARHFGSEVKYQAPFGSNVLTMPTQILEKISSPAEISVLRERDTKEFLKNVRAWSLDKSDQEKMDNLFTLIEDQIGFSLFEKIENTKRQLSSAESGEFSFSYSSIKLREVISRGEFAEHCGLVNRRIEHSLRETLDQSGLAPKDIDLVCATGGTAKVFTVQNILNSHFGVEKIAQFNNFHSIVYGLSRVAQRIESNS